MTTVINLPPHSGYKKIYLVYNFKQVCDSILMIMYNNKLHNWEKTFLNYKCGTWVTDKSLDDADAETLSSLDKRLKKIIPQAENTNHDLPLLQELLPEHALLLLNACS